MCQWNLTSTCLHLSTLCCHECDSQGRAALLMKDAKQGGGYKNLSLTWSRAAKDFNFARCKWSIPSMTKEQKKTFDLMVWEMRPLGVLFERVKQEKLEEAEELEIHGRKTCRRSRLLSKRFCPFPCAMPNLLVCTVELPDVLCGICISHLVQGTMWLQDCS